MQALHVGCSETAGVNTLGSDNIRTLIQQPLSVQHCSYSDSRFHNSSNNIMATANLLSEELLSRSAPSNILGSPGPSSPHFGQTSPHFGQVTSPLSSADWASLLSQSGNGAFGNMTTSPQMNMGPPMQLGQPKGTSAMMMGHSNGDLSPTSALSVDSNALMTTLSGSTNLLGQVRMEVPSTMY